MGDNIQVLALKAPPDSGILIKPQGFNKTLIAKPIDLHKVTTWMLKKAIEEVSERMLHENIHTYDQVLWYEESALQDANLLSQEGVEQGATLRLTRMGVDDVQVSMVTRQTKNVTVFSLDHRFNDLGSLEINNFRIEPKLKDDDNGNKKININIVKFGTKVLNEAHHARGFHFLFLRRIRVHMKVQCDHDELESGGTIRNLKYDKLAVDGKRNTASKTTIAIKKYLYLGMNKETQEETKKSRSSRAIADKAWCDEDLDSGWALNRVVWGTQGADFYESIPTDIMDLDRVERKYLKKRLTSWSTHDPNDELYLQPVNRKESIAVIPFDAPDKDAPTGSYACNVTVTMELVIIKAGQLGRSKKFCIQPSVRTIVAKGTAQVYQHYQARWYNRFFEFRTIQEWMKIPVIVPMVSPVYVVALILPSLLSVWWFLSTWKVTLIKRK